MLKNGGSGLPLPPFLYSTYLQKHNRLLISSRIFVQHLRDHRTERIRQGSAVHGATCNTAHAVDASLVVGVAGVIQRDGTRGAPFSAGAAFGAGFVGRRVEGGGLQLLVWGVAGDLDRGRIIGLCHHIGGEPAAEGLVLGIGSACGDGAVHGMLRNEGCGGDDPEAVCLQRISGFQQCIVKFPVAIDHHGNGLLTASLQGRQPLQSDLGHTAGKNRQDGHQAIMLAQSDSGIGLGQIHLGNGDRKTCADGIGHTLGAACGAEMGNDPFWGVHIFLLKS